MGLILWVIPITAVLIFAAFRGRKVLHITSITTSTIMMIIAGMLTRSVIILGRVEYTALGGIFYIDSLSVIIIDIVLVIGFIISVYSIGYLEEELKHGKIEKVRFKSYYMLMYAFILTMVLALTVKNMGIMWIAIEATTLASTFLVGFYSDKHALEAAWKYIIICSVGITIALLGIVFLYLSSIGILHNSHPLEWTALFDNAKALDSSILKLAFIFILIGFGTKAGIAPMHTWLPDAHSQAPSPISALLSGVLLNSAMYAIIRAVSIVNKNLGDNNFTGRILVSMGILSIFTAAIFMLTQKDYKRLLAYSSIEHMGIITLGIGIFTPVSVFGALFHMINHSFTKSMLFLSSGSILQKYGSREISKVRNVLKILPISGMVSFIGLFAIAGMPPFSIFISEFNIIASIFEKRQFLLGTIFIILISLVFVGIALTLFKIFYGNNVETNLKAGEVNIPGSIVIVALLALTLVTGIYMPDDIKALITNAQKIIVGG